MAKLASLMSSTVFALGLCACDQGQPKGEQGQGVGTSENRAGASGEVAASAAELSNEDPVARDALKLIAQGRRVFRDDTFGDEAFWGGALKLHQAVAGAANGGVGPGLTPEAALGLGLKVDSHALPRKVSAALQRGEVDLKSPATTL
ncbi:MAG TPA: hypothetical protein VK509_24190, partial [Polyangiales bacterium]|nr:hypothetical protein [Polyangiales bacterium]